MLITTLIVCHKQRPSAWHAGEENDASDLRANYGIILLIREERLQIECSHSHPRKKATYTEHDHLFNELIQVFVEEFFEAFCPEIHPRIYYSAINLLEKEVFADIVKGEKRRIAILAETSQMWKIAWSSFASSPKPLFRQIFMKGCLFTVPASTKSSAGSSSPSPSWVIRVERKIPSHFNIEAIDFQIIIWLLCIW